ncbi:MAG: hypothetical protein ACNI3C_01410 [Candidatus Marinarcus sp.]|uniref:hypothetical protein n=1 Tax=Candidatus Marinarcus sp. TaxID=3100987 RepID=UPI003AFFB8B3
MSFKQAKDLVEKIEMTEMSLQKTVKDINEASKGFNEALRHQKIVLEMIPQANKELGIMRVLIAINVGFILGLIVCKYIL